MHVGGERNEGQSDLPPGFWCGRIFCSVHGAVNVFGLHGGEIEEKTISRRSRASSVGGAFLLGSIARPMCQPRPRLRPRSLRCGDWRLLHIFEIKAGDLLFFAVFVEGEILFFKIAKRVSLFVPGHDIYEHQFAGDLNAVLIVGGLIGVLSASGATCASRSALVRKQNNFRMQFVAMLFRSENVLAA